MQSPEIIDGEMVFEPEGEDLPDVFSNNRIDLWAVVIEQLNLAVDLFPRSDNVGGAEEEASVPQSEHQTHRPFARPQNVDNRKKPEKRTLKLLIKLHTTANPICASGGALPSNQRKLLLSRPCQKP